MNFEEFYEDVIGTLGGTLVDVELDDDDVKRALSVAIKTYKQRGGNNERRVIFPFKVSREQMIYSIPEEISQINKFIKPSRSFVTGDLFSQASFNEIFNYEYYGMGSQMITYDLSLQLIENAQKYAVEDIPFLFDRRKKEVRLLKKARGDECWMIDCYMDLSEEEYMDTLWIFRYTVAECKITLGRAYRKFGTLPSPTGESQLDGSELVQEGKEEQRELFEDIDNFVDGAPDGMGVYIG